MQRAAAPDEKLVPSFWLSEFLDSETAVRKGLDNTPPTAALANIRTFLAPGMQRIRECLGVPVHITSGYRSPEVNSAVGGAPNSQHMSGLAADFKAPTFGTPRAIALYLMQRLDELRIDQLIHEGRWVHASFSFVPRHEVLTAHFNGGSVTYSRGVVAGAIA